MRHSLLHDGSRVDDGTPNLFALTFAGGYDPEFSLIDCQRVGMHGSLGNQAVGEWNPDDSRNKGCTSEKEKVPVKAGRFLQRELTGLCG